MALPSLTETVLDPGLGLVEPAADTPLVTGTASVAAKNTLFSISRLSDIRSSLGYGPGAEDVAKMLQERGGPVYFINPTASVAASGGGTATAGSANTGTGTVVISGSATDVFTGKVQITKTGTAGVARFKYTLDNHDSTLFDPTWSADYLIPAGHSSVLTGSGLTITWSNGGFVSGDTYTWSNLPAMQSTTDIAGVATVLLALPSIQIPIWVHEQLNATATTASGIAAAISGHLTSLAGQHRYGRAMVDAGSSDTSANVLAEAENWTSRRVSAWYGTHYLLSVVPYEGFSIRKVSCVASAAARAARELISSDLARFASGALEGVRGIVFDGSLDETLDGVKIATLRRHFGQPGFYIAKARLKSPAGSDFTDWHLGRIMDVACRTVYEALLPFLSESLRTTSKGTLDPKDGAAVQDAANNALAAQLVQKADARGQPGYVSAVKYTVNLTNPFGTTKEVQGQVAVRPKQSADFINTNLGFSLNV